MINYKVKLYKSTTLSEHIAVLCTKSNGEMINSLFVTLEDIEGYVNCMKTLYEYSNKNVKIIRASPYHMIVEQEKEPLVEVIMVDVQELDILSGFNDTINPSEN